MRVPRSTKGWGHNSGRQARKSAVSGDRGRPGVPFHWQSRLRGGVLMRVPRLPKNGRRLVPAARAWVRSFSGSTSPGSPVSSPGRANGAPTGPANSGKMSDRRWFREETARLCAPQRQAEGERRARTPL